jgi:hypothetical protein
MMFCTGIVPVNFNNSTLKKLHHPKKFTKVYTIS